jgi:GTP cyclohydrolase I
MSLKMVQFANPPAKAESDSSEEEIGSPHAGGQNTPNGIGNLKRKSEEGEGSKKRKRKRASKANGELHSRRRHSVSKPARDPRDDPSPSRPAPETPGTRSPSPVIDFDGLSRPSTLLSPINHNF